MKLQEIGVFLICILIYHWIRYRKNQWNVVEIGIHPSNGLFFVAKEKNDKYKYYISFFVFNLRVPEKIYEFLIKGGPMPLRPPF